MGNGNKCQHNCHSDSAEHDELTAVLEWFSPIRTPGALLPVFYQTADLLKFAHFPVFFFLKLKTDMADYYKLSL